MPFNGPTNNDWSTVDTTQPPYTNGIMTLTNDECVQVINALKPFRDQYNDSDVQDVVANYNISISYQYAINGDTYNCLLGYDPSVNTQGIDASGIVPEPTQDASTGSESDVNNTND